MKIIFNRRPLDNPKQPKITYFGPDNEYFETVCSNLIQTTDLSLQSALF